MDAKCHIRYVGIGGGGIPNPNRRAGYLYCMTAASLSPEWWGRAGEATHTARSVLSGNFWLNFEPIMGFCNIYRDLIGDDCRPGRANNIQTIIFDDDNLNNCGLDGRRRLLRGVARAENTAISIREIKGVIMLYLIHWRARALIRELSNGIQCVYRCGATRFYIMTWHDHHRRGQQPIRGKCQMVTSGTQADHV